MTDLETAAREVAARDTTFDNVIPERLWVLTRTSPDRKYIKIYIEVNGIEKEVDSIYVGSYDGIISNAHNLTWILSAAHMQKRIDELEGELKRLRFDKDNLSDSFFKLQQSASDGVLSLEDQLTKERQISKMLEDGFDSIQSETWTSKRHDLDRLLNIVKQTLARVRKLSGTDI